MIKLVNNVIDDDDISKLINWLKTKPRLTKGPLTLKLESNFSKWLGVKYSLFCNSGSSANLLMISTLLESGLVLEKSKIVIPSICWSTNLAPIFQLGLKPILCDINLNNLSVDLQHLENIYLKEKPAALFLVSLLGFSPFIDEILKLSKKHKVIVIEDNCESVGTLYKGKKLGNFGLMSSFSTYYGHHFSTIEGGFVTTNDKKLFDILKMLRSHGWDRDLDNKKKLELRKEWKIDDFNSLYTFYNSGYNLRSTDLQAFIGLNQLKKLNNFCNLRNANFKKYQKNIINDYWKINPLKNTFTSNFGYPVINPKRNKIISKLKKNNVEIRPIISGSIGNQPFYIKKKSRLNLPNSSIVDKYGFYLPVHPEVTHEEILFICDIINKEINN